jgi:uncharacterized membrane protein
MSQAHEAPRGDALQEPAQLSQLVRTFLVVAGAVASLLLAAAPAVLGDDASFVGANALPLGRRLLILALALGGGCVAGTAVLLLSLRRDAPAEFRSAAQTLLAPFILSSFLPVLFIEEAWNGKELAYLAYLLAFGLALERLLRPALLVAERWFPSLASAPLLASARARDRLALAIVVALSLAYVLRVGHLANLSHMKLATMSSDLAEYDNLFFNALNGRPFRSPAIAGHLQNWSTLQGHAEFGLYLLLPFYAISPGAHALLWIQAAVVGLTAIPIHLLARIRLGAFGGICFATAYLLMPSVQQPNFYDFHFTPLGMFFVAWLLYFVGALAEDPQNRRVRVGLYSSAALALLCREDVSIGIAVLGVFLVLSGKLVRDGLYLAASAGVYFVVMKFGVMPLFGRWWFDNMYEDLKADGARGFGAVVLTLVSNPSFTLRTMLTEPKLLYVLHMVAPLLALWLRRPLLWMAVLPGIVQTLLVTNRPPSFQSSFQYTYFWVPYVFAASILATRRGLAGKGTLISLLVAALALSHHFGVFPTGDKIVGGFGLKTFDLTEAERERYEQLRDIISLVPQEATLSATEAEGPHASARLTMYSLKYTLGDNPDYLLVSHPRHRGETQHVRQALESGNYGVIAERGPFVLAKRGADPDNNDVLWQRLGRKKGPRAKRQ